MGRLSVRFDAEGDFLEVTLDHETGYFNDLGDGVFERVDEEREHDRLRHPERRRP